MNSGVRVLIAQLSDTIPTIERYFPLPPDDPKRFEHAFYPKFTDSLFAKAIHDLAGRPLDDQELARNPTYNRLDVEQRKVLLNYTVEEAFVKLEPQFTDLPEIIQTFTRVANRYHNPFPQFEIDLTYGAADLYCGTTLVEMKAYSVMTRHDLIMARNQVLVYACLATFEHRMKVDRIEVANSLTGEIWTWNFQECLQEGEKLYWTLIVPLINNQLEQSEIEQIKQLYQRQSPEALVLAKAIQKKAIQTKVELKRKIAQLEEQLKSEVKARTIIAAKYKEIRPPRPEKEEDGHWIEQTSIE